MRITGFIRIALLLCLSAGAGSAAAEDTELARARAVLESAPLLDTHNDLPWTLREAYGSDLSRIDLSAETELDTDLPKLRAGGVGTQFWSVWVPSGLPAQDAVRIQLEQIDLARRMIRDYPDDLAFATDVAQVRDAERSGRIASLLGIEGAQTFGNSMGVLRAYYALGVRYATLTHFNTVDWADSATDEARHDGLSAFGEEVVREMNRLGMMVDISHVAPATMADALRVSRAPVIFSHSGARGLTDHPRNVPDDVLRALRENGGIVMVPFIPMFVSDDAREWASELIPLLRDAQTDADWARINDAYVVEHGQPPRATLADVADHIDYIVEVAGIDHVGIGADFYNAKAEHEVVEGLEDASTYPKLFAELIRRGWSDDDLRKLSRENFLRTFSDVEQAAEGLRGSEPSTVVYSEDAGG